MGNIVNRVFDSSGPEGKVRGTPQQIIDKYVQLARDASLGNDRIAAENFQQHAEHYTRMLGEAQREQEARREQQEQQQQQQQQQRDRQRERHEGSGGGNAPETFDDQVTPARPAFGSDAMQSVESVSRQPDLIEDEGVSSPQPDLLMEPGIARTLNGLVETPENQPKPRKPRSRKPRAEEGAEAPAPTDEAAPKPRRPRASRAKAKPAPEGEPGLGLEGPADTNGLGE